MRHHSIHTEGIWDGRHPSGQGEMESCWKIQCAIEMRAEVSTGEMNVGVWLYCPAFLDCSMVFLETYRAYVTDIGRESNFAVNKICICIYISSMLSKIRWKFFQELNNKQHL